MIAAIIYFHIILHPAVHIYDCHIFITLRYFPYFSIFYFASPSKGELMPLPSFSLFGLKLHVISLNLIAFIISIETEVLLLALAKSVFTKTESFLSR